MRKILTIVFIIFLSIIFTDSVSADNPVAGASAQIRAGNQMASDFRAVKLSRFLESYSSPLAPYAEEFVAEADKYNIDWRLVASISGVESTFGKQIPYNSYNAYGWANGDYKFTSWNDSIEVVSKTLREKYLDKNAATIDQIARRYAPPSATWGNKVKYFMKKIEAYPLEFTLEG